MHSGIIWQITFSVARPTVEFSGRLECITLIDRNSVLSRLNAKIVPIQPLRCNAMLDGTECGEWRWGAEHRLRGSRIIGKEIIDRN